MTLKTHLRINTGLCGTVRALEPGKSEVVLETTVQMAADDQGLVHGGFVFGAADFAAMAAINDPLVVLAGSECRFLAPTRAGETMVFAANVVSESGAKRQIDVQGRCGDTLVFEGVFNAVITRRHVLD